PGPASEELPMLQVFGFDRIGVLMSDLYFVDPSPGPGQEGAERGVRLEVRMLEQGRLTGSIYSARPIKVGQPIWRADLLETADGPPGSLNRAHHHPGLRNWEPGSRVFDPELSASPVQWVAGMLSDLDRLLELSGIEPDAALRADAESLRAWVPQISRALAELLEKVRAGELAAAPAGELVSARVSWL
ncbi:MAG: hypothetical protein ACLP70_19005, partial [Streptosporangiaceae bacterium]